MITYKLGNPEGVIKINGDVKNYIPTDEANTDYQEYLQWLDEGNTPEPADEVTV